MQSKKIYFGIPMLILLTTILFFSCSKESTQGPTDVYMEGTSFSPSTLTISAGTTVTWTNKSSFIHTVSSYTGLFDSGDMGKNDTFSYTFASPGTYEYHCIHHTGMTGSIIVQ